MDNSRNKELIIFKLYTILCIMMKFHAILLRPSWDMNNSFVSVSTLCIEHNKILRERNHIYLS